MSKPVYMVTHSLLSSWLHAMRDNPYEDATSERDSKDEFMKVLRREPTETTEAMQNGIDFEDLVTDVIHGCADTGHRWYDAAAKVAKQLGDAPLLQYKAKKTVEIAGANLLLNGRLDALKAGLISDIKFSKSYDRGKYLDSTQHPMYLELIPDAYAFRYIISDGSNVWSEYYQRHETPSIKPIVSDFIDWLHATGNWETYCEHWRVSS